MHHKLLTSVYKLFMTWKRSAYAFYAHWLLKMQANAAQTRLLCHMSTSSASRHTHLIAFPSLLCNDWTTSVCCSDESSRRKGVHVQDSTVAQSNAKLAPASGPPADAAAMSTEDGHDTADGAAVKSAAGACDSNQWEQPDSPLIAAVKVNCHQHVCGALLACLLC